MTGRTCGNCKYFVRIRSFGQDGIKGRNGIREKLDYNCHSDTPAEGCKHYHGKRYERSMKTFCQ